MDYLDEYFRQQHLYYEELEREYCNSLECDDEEDVEINGGSAN